MGKSKPEPEQGFGNVVKAMSSAGHNINAFARTVLAGKGTPGQIIFFAVGILGFAAIVLGITLASAKGDPNLLLWMFVGLAIVVVVLIVAMTGKLNPSTGTRAASAAEVQLQMQLDRVQHECDGLKATIADLQAQLHKAEGDKVRLKKGLAEINTACTQIYLQMTKEPRFPSILEEFFTLSIEADGTMIGERHTQIQATTDYPQQILVYKLSGDASVESFWDLGIRVSSLLDGNEIAVLPAHDAPGEKHALLFFLPEIPKGNRAAFIFRWQWTGFWKPLLNNLVDEFRWKVSSATPVPKLRFRFLLDPQIKVGSHLDLKSIGLSKGNQVHPPIKIDARGYRVFEYEATPSEKESELVIALRIS